MSGWDAGKQWEVRGALLRVGDNVFGLSMLVGVLSYPGEDTWLQFVGAQADVTPWMTREEAWKVLALAEGMRTN